MKREYARLSSYKDYYGRVTSDTVSRERNELSVASLPELWAALFQLFREIICLVMFWMYVRFGYSLQIFAKHQ